MKPCPHTLEMLRVLKREFGPPYAPLCYQCDRARWLRGEELEEAMPGVP